MKASAVDRFFEFSLLGLIVSGFCAVAGSGELDWPTVVLCLAAFCARALMIWGVIRWRVPDLAVAGCAAAYLLFYAADVLWISLSFIPATAHLLFFLVVVRILTARSTRDHLFTAVLGFLELVAGALLSVSLSFVLALGAFLLCAIASLASGEIRRASRGATHGGPVRGSGLGIRLAGLTVTATAAILAIAGTMFFLIPRTANALSSRLTDRRFHVTGFSNEVRLGEIGEIQRDSRPLLHVKPYSRDLPLNMKWRGESLSRFDGKRWFAEPGDRIAQRVERGPVTVADGWQRRRIGKRILYRVDAGDLDTDTLFVAGVPEFINVGSEYLARLGDSRFELVQHRASEPVRYEVSAFVEETRPNGERHDWLLPARDRERYLQLPPLDPRIRALAKRQSDGAATEYERARAIEQHLRQDYGYTLEQPARAPADPVAHFLFKRRKGHCEYFASAMALELRTLGIPARVVNGFQGGTLNPYSNLLVLRASDAHSWVEAFLPGRGWTVFDPTPPAVTPAASPWLNAALWFDAMDSFWHEWIVSYNFDRQVTLAEQGASRLGEPGSRWAHLSGWAAGTGRAAREHLGMLIGAGVLALALGFAAVWGPSLLRLLQNRAQLRRVRSGRATTSDAAMLYERLLALLARRGYHKPAWATPREFAGTVSEPDLAGIVQVFTEDYLVLRFGGDASRAQEMAKLLEQIA